MSKFYQIGEVLENGQIEKGASSQGMIYKSLEAFINKTGVCYVPELDDTEYTYMDFYNLVNGNEEIARVLFDQFSIMGYDKPLALDMGRVSRFYFSI